ncbi:MAG: hypothetical protein Aurels2KO_06710 [Aureliella sp.]
MLADVQSRDTHVVTFPLTIQPGAYELAMDALTPDEVARAKRFVFDDVRRRFVVCRFRVRQLLAKLLNATAGEVRFSYSKWGKPELASSMQKHASAPGHVTPIRFNVSNSGETGVLAVSRLPVGIDVEVVQQRFSHRSILSQVVSPRELNAWEQIPPIDRDAAMMQLWVCKEALLKAMGLGIAEGLQQVSFPLPIPSTVFAPTHIGPELLMHLDDDGTCRTTDWIDSDCWRLQILPSEQGTYLAIATAKSQANVVIHGMVLD